VEDEACLLAHGSVNLKCCIHFCIKLLGALSLFVYVIYGVKLHGGVTCVCVCVCMCMCVFAAIVFPDRPYQGEIAHINSGFTS